ncbi:MAG: ribonuclease Z [Candidatus Bathyarchaeia archaeon]
MRVIFLGTSGSIPTPTRGAPAIAVVREGEVILFDCGEGTQQKMFAARLGFRRPTKIFITHLHGDHILGLPGLLQTMSLLGRECSLQIYGPRGTLEFLKAFTSILGEPNFLLEVVEVVEGGKVCDGRGYKVLAISADHSQEAWSYALVEEPRPGRFHPEKALKLGVPEGPLWKRLQQGEAVTLLDGRVVRHEEAVDPPRPGRRVVYSGDTRPNEELVELAMGADLLIHESTFGDELAEKAFLDGHSTPSQAAEVARRAGVGELILTHISPRYAESTELLEQAKGVFEVTRVAEDLMEVEVPLKG